MNKKKEYGQFFTTNCDYILQGFYIPKEIKTIIEPFCGNKDLLNFLKKRYILELYDIDPKSDDIICQDTLKNPPEYKNKFILTNPPYLARNKSKNKELFDKYDVNDLYKCFLKQIINDKPLGGILVIPINFWCSIRKNDLKLRKDFLNTFNIIRVNLFEEQVFNDTSSTVCSFQFTLKEKDENNICFHIFPSKKEINIELNDDNNYTIGGEIFSLSYNDKYKVNRLTNKNKHLKYTNILVKCIDDSNKNKIGVKLVEDKDIYIDSSANESARTYATLVIEPYLSLDKQEILVNEFNHYLNEVRTKYNSLFLTNYRESKDIARKRITFDLVYNIVKHLLYKLNL